MDHIEKGIGRAGRTNTPSSLRFGEIASPASPSFAMAAARHDRDLAGWDGRGLDRLDRFVSRAISQFSPRNVPESLWSRAESLVREAAVKAAPRSGLSAQKLMTVITELVVWVDMVGLSLEPSVVFHPDHIDRFVLEGCAHLAPGTRSNYRGQLRTAGAAALGPELFPLAPLPLSRPEPLAPYTSTEIALLRSWGRGMPTAHFRLGIATILAFTLGAGLTSPELFDLVGTDVVTADGGVNVRVNGDRAREIPVLETWADEVRELAKGVGPRPVFTPHRTGKKTGRSRIANFIATCRRATRQV